MQTRQISNAPLVSIIVPAYNAETYIEQTLYSLVTQTYPNCEIIVVDDGSEDGTLRRAEVMAREHPQIRVIRQANLGVAAARNRGIKESRGEFIAPVDADDIWFPDAITKLVNCLLASDSRIGVAYAWSVIIDENGLLDGRFRCSPIEGNAFRTLLCHNFLGHASATLIRRACFEKVGGYDDCFRQGCEDWDLYLRIAQHYQFKVVPKFLFSYRKSHNAMSSNRDSMAQAHRQLLDKVKQQYSHIPRAFYRLSTSIYYLYLAYDCHHQNQPNESFKWLRRALINAPLFTLVRVVFYLLVARNLGMILGTSMGRLIHRLSRGTPRNRRIIRVADVERKRVRILLRTAAQNALHHIMKRVSVS